MLTRPSLRFLVPIFLACTGVCHAQSRYDVTDLGNLNLFASEYCEATGINISGAITGQCQGSLSSRGFVWTQALGMTQRQGPNNSTQGHARAINDSGLVVGESTPASINTATVWPVGDIPMFVPPFLSGSYSTLLDVNATGLAVGYGTGGQSVVGFAWQEGVGGTTILPTVAGSTGEQAIALNDSGVIVGAIIKNSVARACVWNTTSSVPVELGALPGALLSSQSLATEITEGGTIFGNSQRPDEVFEVVRWEGATPVVIAGLTACALQGANNVGRLVGERFEPALNQNRGWMWDELFGYQDLTSRLAPGSTAWTILGARGVNDAGLIVAIARNGARTTAVLLTPAPDVPECDSLDFNADGVSPDSGDIDDIIAVFGGGACSNDPNCGDLDFNNDEITPDTADIDAFLRVFGGGECAS